MRNDPKYHAKNDATLSIRIPEKMKKELERAAQETSRRFEYPVSLSRLVSKIIEDYLNQRRGY